MSHSYTKLNYHCVFSTKDRRAMIKGELRDRLYAYMRGILRELGGRMIACGGTADHVHLFIEAGPTLPIADIMRVVKANSSKWVRETFPAHASFSWQTGYAAFSVSASGVGKVIEYVDDQERHHREQSFEDEIAGFLVRHGIEYDKRYLLG